MSEDLDEATRKKLDPLTEVLDMENFSKMKQEVDLVVTIGGDGTLLYSSTLFGNSKLPVILPFSMGTLGFLMTFEPKEYKQLLERIILDKRVEVIQRDRLQYSILNSKDNPKINNSNQCLNEVILHRGVFSQLVRLDVLVDEKPFTNVLADGLIVATPTGSTAYSLSSGGPIVHPKVRCMLLNPICPRSLSFRPIMLPVDSKIRLSVSDDSRGDLYIQVDGSKKGMLKKSEVIQIGNSDHPMLCVSRSNNLKDTAIETTEKGEWKDDICTILKWNQSFTRKD